MFTLQEKNLLQLSLTSASMSLLFPEPCFLFFVFFFPPEHIIFRLSLRSRPFLMVWCSGNCVPYYKCLLYNFKHNFLPIPSFNRYIIVIYIVTLHFSILFSHLFIMKWAWKLRGLRVDVDIARTPWTMMT